MMFFVGYEDVKLLEDSKCTLYFAKVIQIPLYKYYFMQNSLEKLQKYELYPYKLKLNEDFD